MRLGRLDEAEEHARLALAHDAAAAHELPAQIALCRGDLDIAESEAMSAMSLENRRAGPRLVLADVLLVGGRPAEAVGLLEATIEDGIHNEAVHRKLALVLMAAVEGRLVEVRRMLEEGLERASGSFEGWNALGMVRARGGDHDGAVKA